MRFFRPKHQQNAVRRLGADQQLLNTLPEADAAGISRKRLRSTLSSTQQEELASYLNQSELLYEDFLAISEPYLGSSKIFSM